MERITHRQLRNDSSEILKRVQAGESFEVSNNGESVAHLVPIRDDNLSNLVARGQARAPRGDLASLRGLKRVKLPVASSEIVDDVRGRW